MLTKLFVNINLHRFWMFSLYSFLFFLLTVMYWVFSKFGGPTLEQVTFHLQYGEGLLENTDRTLVRSFVTNCILTSCAYAAVLLFLEYRLYEYLKSRSSLVSQKTYKIVHGKFPLILSVVAGYYFYALFDPFSILENAQDDFFKNQYIPAAVHAPQKGGTKNLILIYVESLERAYLNRDLFPTAPLSPLEQLAGFELSEYRQLPGTSWTIAGISSTQCGIPLKPVASNSGNRQGEILKSFLPRAICLGDVLATQGYESVFLGGADLRFSGKGKFLRSHGYSKIMGRAEWLASGRYRASQMNQWGLYDHDLFSEARVELDRLLKKKGPFNLTILTVDTHFPTGFMSPRCKKRGAKIFEDIVRCSAQEVADFIKYAESHGALKNTNVVILGDHLTMPNPVMDKLDSLDERFIYNKWISKENSQQHAINPQDTNRQDIVHFDIAPTILEFLGFKVVEGRFGLGVSASVPATSQVAQERFEELKNKIPKKSDFYMQLWIPLDPPLDDGIKAITR